MRKNPEGYMTTPGERRSYWTYFVGQNVYYNITAAFISTYLAMQGIALWKVSLVLLVVLFMSFNTQNLIANIYFWLFPMMALVERGMPLLNKGKQKE